MASETSSLLPSVITRSVSSSGANGSRSPSNDSLEDDTLLVSGSTPFTSCKAAVFLTVNAALGAGLLNMPFAFQSGGGLVTGSITQIIFVLFIMTGLVILTYCAHVSGARSVQQVVKYYCGKRVENLTSICIVLYTYGTCLTFIIITGDQMDRVLASTYGSDFCQNWYMTRSFTMTAVSLLLILPLSISENIDFLTFSR